MEDKAFQILDLQETVEARRSNEGENPALLMLQIQTGEVTGEKQIQYLELVNQDSGHSQYFTAAEVVVEENSSLVCKAQTSARKPNKANESCHLRVSRDLFDLWCQIGISHSLTSDTEVAKFLIHMYEVIKSNSHFTICCISCSAPLPAICRKCRTIIPQQSDSACHKSGSVSPLYTACHQSGAVSPSSVTTSASLLSVPFTKSTMNMVPPQYGELKSKIHLFSADIFPSEPQISETMNLQELNFNKCCLNLKLFGGKIDNRSAVIIDHQYNKGNENGYILPVDSEIIPVRSSCLVNSELKTEIVEEIVSGNNEIVSRDGEIASRNGEIVSRNGEIVSRDGEIVSRDGEIVTRDGEIAEELVEEIVSKDGEMEEIIESNGELAITPAANKNRQQSLMVGPSGHIEQPEYKCEKCGALFRRCGNLAKHIQSHKGHKPYKCSHCEAAFITAGNLTLHLQTHTGRKSLECEKCGIVFTQSVKLKLHMESHNGQKPYRCQQCGSGFTTPGRLNTHIQKHAVQKQRKTFKCAQCGIIFTKICNLARHMRIHTGQKPYKCEQCGRAFRQSNDLKRHIRSHSTQKTFLCHFCGSAFKGPEMLVQHMRTHTGQRPFKCLQCEATFARSSCLTEHMRIHSGCRPYKCNQCEAAFTQSGSLTSHMLSHTGEKPYRCSQCGAAFTKSYTLTLHLKDAHTGQTPYKCPYCEASFTQMRHQKRHIKTAHSC